MTIRELQKKIHEAAKARGWWSRKDRNIGEILVLIHCEISEAFEEYRNGHPVDEVRIENGKPEGFPVEIADAAIRILDACEGLGIDLQSVMDQKMAYNETRSHRHGGKLA